MGNLVFIQVLRIVSVAYQFHIEMKGTIINHAKSNNDQRTISTRLVLASCTTPATILSSFVKLSAETDLGYMAMYNSNP